MKKNQLVKKLDELARVIIEDINEDELTDYAREQACWCIVGAIQHIKDNTDLKAD